MPIVVTFRCEFDSEDEKDHVKRMLKADDAFSALDNIDNSLRGVSKHWNKERFTVNNVLNLVEELRDLISETGMRDIYR